MADLFRQVQAGSPSDGLTRALWIRRALLAVFLAFVALALADVFGQAPEHKAVASPAAELRLSAPAAVRGGLFFQSRIEVHARRTIEHPRLVLDEGWLEDMQVNSIEPSPVSESSRDGLLVLSYDKLDAGDTLIVWLQFEVNPTNVGHRPYGVELDDGTTPLATVEHEITVFP